MRSPRDFRFSAKRPRRDRPQMNVKPRNLKVSGLLCFAPGASDRGEAAELDQAGLVWMKRQRELHQALAHRIPESSGIGLPLKADDDVVGVAHDDRCNTDAPPSPAVGPKVEDVVQVDVGEER